MGLLKSLRRSLQKKRTLKFRMKGGSCGNQHPDAFTGSTLASTATIVGGGRRRRRTGRRRSRGGSRRRR
tara:strand:- start:476 stop:682 length:207 start_codon:yes stop_codon:yes gene_type:complete